MERGTVKKTLCAGKKFKFIINKCNINSGPIYAVKIKNPNYIQGHAFDIFFCYLIF